MSSPAPAATTTCSICQQESPPSNENENDENCKMEVETSCALCWQLRSVSEGGEAAEDDAILAEVVQPPRPPRRREKSPDKDDSFTTTAATTGEEKHQGLIAF